jgi:hypothetical protein
MQFAFNFDEILYHELQDGNYPALLGLLAAEAVVECVPPHRGHCMIQIGSVPNYPESGTGRDALRRALIEFPPRWRGFLLEDAFKETIGTGGLCAIVVNGIAPQDAAEIDEKWRALNLSGYIGSYQLLHGYALHEGLYFMYLPPIFTMYKNSLAFYVNPDVIEGDGDYDDTTYDALVESLPHLGGQ